jgi:inositol transport system substrate-binding protein
MTGEMFIIAVHSLRIIRGTQMHPCDSSELPLMRGAISGYSGGRKTWRFKLRVATLAGAVALTAFRLANSAPAADQKVIGATVLSSQSPYLVAISDAMKAEAAKEGIDLICLDSGQSVMTEKSHIESLITRKVDLIIMSPVEQMTSKAAAMLVNKAGIPLLLLTTTFDNGFRSDGGKFVAYVGSDNTAAGEIEGRYLADKLPEGGNVVYLAIEYGRSVTELRKAGFESVTRDHPNLEIVTELQGYGSRAKGKAIMETLLQKYGRGQLQALVAENDEMAIGASSAIQAANRLGEFKVLIGVNGSKAGLDAVAAGTLTATVFQDAVRKGTQIVVAAGKTLAGQAVEAQFLVPLILVTRENVSSFR